MAFDFLDLIGFKRKPVEVIVHCSATPDDNEPGKRWHDLDISEVDKWHKAKGWSGVGYHKFIKRDGTIQDGRPIGSKGAHTKGRNWSIGVCYAGTRDPNEKQKDAMKSLLAEFRDSYGINIYEWRCHYEYSNKACPGFGVEYLHMILQDKVSSDNIAK